MKYKQTVEFMCSELIPDTLLHTHIAYVVLLLSGGILAGLRQLLLVIQCNYATALCSDSMP